MGKNIKFVIAAPAMLLILLQSCSMDEEHLSAYRENNVEEASSQIFMRTIQEYKSVEMTQSVEYFKNSAFYSSKIASLKANKSPYTGVGNITIETGNIPIWRTNSVDHTIYADGRVKFSMEFKIIEDEEYNAILGVTGDIVDFDKVPAKASYADGVMTLYGPKNNVLSEGPSQQPDLKEFKDTVEYYMQLYREMQSDPGTKSELADISNITRRLRKRGFDMSNATVTLSNNCVVLQQEIKMNPAQIQSYNLISGDNITNKTVLSLDLMKVYATYQMIGEQLLSCSYYRYPNYNNDIYLSVAGSEAKISLPSRVQTMELDLSDNEPKVHTKIVSYTKNRIILYDNQ